MQSNRFGHVVKAAVLTAMAGGLGWGIRGQYGHETGAMIAGVLIGFALVLCFLPRASSRRAARVVALAAIGISFGGSMTYGQTIGLTHDAPLIGNWAAFGWGMFGLLVKGGIWMGFAGAFLGMGLSICRYRPLEVAMLLPTLFVLLCVGIGVLNQPFDPENQLLPRIYFSDHWYWEPGSELKPRPENWGGLLFALVGLTAYLGFIRGDRMARNMAVVGFIAGGIGFPGGQCVQAFHAWNREGFNTGAIAALEPYLRHVNWWNMMEITFGAISGFGLAVGVWLNRGLIAIEKTNDDEAAEISPTWEFVLCGCHLFLLIGSSFSSLRVLEAYQSFGLILCAVPLIGVIGGRYWPYLMALPVVAVPIAAKTVHQLSYKNTEVTVAAGWVLFVVLPLGIALAAALWLAYEGQKGQTSRPFARIGLVVATWLYFALNFAFFRLPWPWAEWTGRTPSAILMAVCAVSLTIAAVFPGRRSIR